MVFVCVEFHEVRGHFVHSSAVFSSQGEFYIEHIVLKLYEYAGKAAPLKLL